MMVISSPVIPVYDRSRFVHIPQTYQVSGYRSAYNCDWIGSLNRYDAPLYYFVAEGAALTGVRSSYRNKHE